MRLAGCTGEGGKQNVRSTEESEREDRVTSRDAVVLETALLLWVNGDVMKRMRREERGAG